MPGWVGAAQNLQENNLMMQTQQANLQSMALNQEGTKLAIDAKKADLANQEAFKQHVLAQLAVGEDNQSQLATLSNQPTPFQGMQNELAATTDKIKTHVSLVQATQKAIETFAKTDPIYAMKMQEDLNKQIEDGFKLTKDHNDIVAKEASKVSDELAPVVNAGGVPGKIDPELYKEWYARNKADGVPLASMGLTGDPAVDDKAIRLIYSKGVAAKDQATQQAKMLKAKQQQWRDEQMQQYHTESLAIRRSDEALKRERLSFEKTKAGTTKDPKVAMQKELNTIHNQYMNQYQRLIKERDKSSTESGKTVVNERIQKLNELYGQQKRDVANSFGVPIPGAKETGPVKSASDFMAKYGLQ